MSPPTERIKFAYAALGLFAVVIFLKIGTLKSSEKEDNANHYGNSVENITREAMSRSEVQRYKSCLAGKSPEKLVRLTTALVAVENFARPRWQRRLEMAVAKGWLLLTGRLPDLSLGIAQVRVSTARKLEAAGGTPVSDRKLLQLLSDDCSCIQLAYQYVVSLSQSERCQGSAKGLQSEEEGSVEWPCGHSTVRDYNGQSANQNLGRGFWRKLYEDVTFNVFEKSSGQENSG